MKPRIGITLDIAQEGSFSKRPHYALRVHYFDLIQQAGGIAIPIPHLPTLIDDYLDMIDALIIPGGEFATPNDWYENPDADALYAASSRLDFDLVIIKKALERDMPILGICAGMQLMAGMAGCKMTQDLHKRYQTNIDHMDGAPAEEYCHPIDITAGSLLESIYGKTRIDVNSAHREALVDCSENVTIAATAPDGIIEAIELKGHHFALGVQWHPEFFLDDPLVPALMKAIHR